MPQSKDKEWLNGLKKKKRPLYMLSTRDPPQNQGHVQTEREQLEKRYVGQMENKRKQE